MKRRYRALLWLVASYGMCHCASAHRAEVRVDEHSMANAVDKEQAKEVLTVERHEGASRTTTTVEEYGPLQAEVPKGPAEARVLLPGQVGQGDHRQAEGQHPAEVATGLIRKTVIYTETDPSDTTLRDEAEQARQHAAQVTRALAEQAETESSLKPAMGLPWWLWVGLALAAGVGVWWKIRG